MTSRHVPPAGNPAAKDVPPRTMAYVEGKMFAPRYANRETVRRGPSGKRRPKWL